MIKNDKSSRLLFKFAIGFIISKRIFFKNRIFEFFRDLRWPTISRPRGDVEPDLSNFSKTNRSILAETFLNYYFAYFLIQPVLYTYQYPDSTVGTIHLIPWNSIKIQNILR